MVFHSNLEDFQPFIFWTFLFCSFCLLCSVLVGPICPWGSVYFHSFFFLCLPGYIIFTHISSSSLILPAAISSPLLSPSGECSCQFQSPRSVSFSGFYLCTWSFDLFALHLRGHRCHTFLYAWLPFIFKNDFVISRQYTCIFLFSAVNFLTNNCIKEYVMKQIHVTM